MVTANNHPPAKNSCHFTQLLSAVRFRIARSPLLRSGLYSAKTRLFVSFFDDDDDDWPYRSYCVESACNDVSSESLLLIRIEEEDGIEKALCWVHCDSLYTWKQAELFYGEQCVGPSEEVMHEIIEVFRNVFEFAVESNWTNEKRLEFYHLFPCEEFSTKEDVTYSIRICCSKICSIKILL